MENEGLSQPVVRFLSNLAAEKAARTANDPQYRDQWLEVLERAKAGEFVLKLNGQQMVALLSIYFRGMVDALKEDGETFLLAFKVLNAAIPLGILPDGEFAELHEVTSKAALDTARSIIQSIQLPV